MTISQAELGARLRQARESAGLTQDQVGRELGISRSAVTLIENGTRAVSSLELDRLAFLFGRDIRDFFAAEFGAENALAVLFRRNPDIADDPKSMSALRHCMAVGRELTNLERLVGIDRDSSDGSFARDQRNPHRLGLPPNPIVNLHDNVRRLRMPLAIKRAQLVDRKLHDPTSCRSVTRFCPANTIAPLTQFKTSMTPAMGAATAISIFIASSTMSFSPAITC